MIRSILSYSGSKYSLLKQILPLFPQNINTFYDMFCGALNVSLNVNANKIIANDTDIRLIHLLNIMRFCDDECKQYIITQYHPKNKSEYLLLRSMYNKTKDPYMLYVLSRNSFNRSIRFNKNGCFNVSYGECNGYDALNDDFRLKAQKIKLLSKDAIELLKTYIYEENDFIYLDPPYLITNAIYNNTWKEEKEIELLNTLKNIKCKWALSNVLEHKGKSNDILKEFSKNYNVHYLTKNYNNWNNASKIKSNGTIEVLITNY